MMTVTNALLFVIGGAVCFIAFKLEKLEERIADIERLITDAISEERLKRERDLMAARVSSDVVARLGTRGASVPVPPTR